MEAGLSDIKSAQVAAPLPWGARHALLGVPAGLLALVFALPAAVVVAHLLLPRFETWSHLASTVLPGYLWNTLALGVGVAVGVTVIGVGCAWLTAMCRFPGQGWLSWALILPIAAPAYVLAYLYTDLLQFSGPLQSSLRALTGWSAGDYAFPDIRSLWGATCVLVAVLYPYVYLLARTAFLELSASSLETARMLGQGAWGSFLYVALPLARPAIVAGLALALMETLADYGTVAYFGVDTFSTGVLRAWFSMGDPVAAAQLGALLLLGVGAVVMLERKLRGRSAFHGGIRRAPQPYALSGGRAVLALLACVIPLLLGFALPVVLLMRLALQEVEPGFAGRFLQLAGNSLTLSMSTACVAVTGALLLSYAARLQPGRLTQAASRVAGLGYAVPGVVIAIGVLVPVTALDRWLSGWLAQSFGLAPRLWLTGTIVALVYACAVRFMSIALQTIEAGLGKIRRNMDDAARSLGLSPLRTLLEVHAPLLARSLLTALLLVFVDVMKELPATLAMRPFNFDTLAVQTFNLAKDERLTEASFAALAIVAVGLIPVLMLARQAGRR